MTEEKDRLEQLLSAYEDAVIAAADDDLESADNSAAVAGIVAGVLKAYGYQRDGARLPVAWRRSRANKRGMPTRPAARTRIAQEPLRASFSATSDEYDDDDNGDADR